MSALRTPVDGGTAELAARQSRELVDSTLTEPKIMSRRDRGAEWQAVRVALPEPAQFADKRHSCCVESAPTGMIIMPEGVHEQQVQLWCCCYRAHATQSWDEHQLGQHAQQQGTAEGAARSRQTGVTPLVAPLLVNRCSNVSLCIYIPARSTARKTPLYCPSAMIPDSPETNPKLPKHKVPPLFPVPG